MDKVATSQQPSMGSLARGYAAGLAIHPGRLGGAPSSTTAPLYTYTHRHVHMHVVLPSSDLEGNINGPKEGQKEPQLCCTARALCTPA